MRRWACRREWNDSLVLCLQVLVHPDLRCVCENGVAHFAGVERGSFCIVACVAKCATAEMQRHTKHIMCTHILEHIIHVLFLSFSFFVVAVVLAAYLTSRSYAPALCVCVSLLYCPWPTVPEPPPPLFRYIMILTCRCRLCRARAIYQTLNFWMACCTTMHCFDPCSAIRWDTMHTSIACERVEKY